MGGMSLMTRLLHIAGQRSRKKAALAFDAAAASPRKVQEAYLLALLAKNANTAYGREHQFSSLRTPAEFAARVPFMEPLALQPHVRREMAGEGDVLTAEPP